MRFAVMECVSSEGGHEIDFDRILVEELSALGHGVEFYVPQGHKFKFDYGVPVHFLSGAGVSYDGARGMKKILLAARREYHRQLWYGAMYDFAKQDAFDAIIFPSATYRYLRALKISRLRKSPVPVLFLIHGLTPKEAKKLDEAASPFRENKNIRIGVQTFAAKKLKLKAAHTLLYNPPNYVARDINPDDFRIDDGVLRLGVFGQYRREKNIEAFVRAFLDCDFKRPAKLIVQGATTTAADSADFERLIKKYGEEKSVEFWHKALIGAEWQKGLAATDAIVMPYGGDRYLYHTSAIISNAMGVRRAVIAADNVNPEILANYDIGCSFRHGDMADLKRAIEEFVNGYDAKKERYESELLRAYNDFSPTKLAENIVKLAE